jgi:mannosyltransferase OCH1-like enzyme
VGLNEVVNDKEKIVHLCWFKGNKLTKEANAIIQKYKTQMPDYTFHLWTEDCLYLKCHKELEDAYTKKDWNGVKSYIKKWTTSTFGGEFLEI